MWCRFKMNPDEERDMIKEIEYLKRQKEWEKEEPKYSEKISPDKKNITHYWN